MSISPDTNEAPEIVIATIPAPRDAADDQPTPERPADDTGPADGTVDRGDEATAGDLCRCGHDHDAHVHYRSGTDCGICGTACRAFRAAAQRPGHRARPIHTLRETGRRLRRSHRRS